MTVPAGSESRADAQRDSLETWESRLSPWIKSEYRVTGTTRRPGDGAALPVTTEPETENTNKEEAMVLQCER